MAAGDFLAELAEPNARTRRAPCDARPSSIAPHHAAARGDQNSNTHDRAILVTACGRTCLHRKKINISTVLAGQKLGI